MFWTSEAVSAGHPDKVADQIADAILDGYLTLDANARVACEVVLTKDQVIITGEIASNVEVDIESIVRNVLIEIGYDRPEHSYDGHSVPIKIKLNKQSPEIAHAVCHKDGQIGAGDQGVMFGYATNETDTYMPYAHHLAFELIKLLEDNHKKNRKSGQWNSFLLPDAKTQVTVSYNDDKKIEQINTIVVSTQHRSGLTLSDVRSYVNKEVIVPFREKYHSLFKSNTKLCINPAGTWNVGGPAADTGLSGRKIVVDNYGPDCPIGGGSFSGKDPSKVDRSAAYMARYIAKNMVAAGLASSVRIQLAYIIGMIDPASFTVEGFGEKRYTNKELSDFIADNLTLTPKAIIDRLGLKRPIYRATAAGGHFGRNSFPWERLDLVDLIRKRM